MWTDYIYPIPILFLCLFLRQEKQEKQETGDTGDAGYIPNSYAYSQEGETGDTRYRRNFTTDYVDRLLQRPTVTFWKHGT